MSDPTMPAGLAALPEGASEAYPSRIWKLNDLAFEQTEDGHVLVTIEVGRYTTAEVVLSRSYVVDMAEMLLEWAALAPEGTSEMVAAESAEDPA